MSTEPTGPTEQELRAAYEAELNRITTTEMILQASASLLNIGARRLGLTGPSAGDQAPERDLEQVRDAIDGVSGLLTVLERTAPQECRPLREALSQLQLAYAREATGTPASGVPGAQPRPAAPQTAGQPAAGSEGPAKGQESPDPGPAQASGRLWVPGR